MKHLALAWLALLGAAFVFAGSCAIEHRSGAFECTRTSDCDAPRVCSDGLCVSPSGTIDAPGKDGSIDAPTDSPRCPPQCSSCNPQTMQCIIDCGAGANCTGPVTCPEKWNCDIRCTQFGSCSQGINCQEGESCEILCSGRQSCQKVVCGGGPCELTCSGRDSCVGLTCGTDRCNVACTGPSSCKDVKCGASCACDVACNAGAACDGVSCTGLFCGSGRGCTSQGFGCNTCM